MGKPLVGKDHIREALDKLSWGKIIKLRKAGLPVFQLSNAQSDPWISDETVLHEWWEKYIRKMQNGST